MAAPTTTPPLFRALHHLAESGYEPEADSAFALSRATCWSEPIARGTRHLDFLERRTRLEYNVRTGNMQRMGWLVDRGGVEARVWDEEGGESWWKLALFDTPRPEDTDEDYVRAAPRLWPVWPVPTSFAHARKMLIRKVGGAPHDGFVQPPIFSPEWGAGPRIEGPLAAWRAANPDALVANVQGRDDLVDADFVHLAGIKLLRMDDCTNPGLTDAAFVHLRGLHTLLMGSCNQASITDAAFANLHGLHTLSIVFCDQPTITDATFLQLRGIQELYLCNQATITGMTLPSIRGVRILGMLGCGMHAIATAREMHLPVYTDDSSDGSSDEFSGPESIGSGLQL